jgi:two-component system, OmpR family, flagellar system response regulator FtcR
MLVLIDEREIVSVGYVGGFRNEGVSSTGLKPTDFRDWVSGVSDGDLAAIEAFLIGACNDRHAYPRHIRERSSAPIIAINETHSLEQTLDLFNAGFDDVVRKPVHVRELMARIDAIRRRAQARKDDVQFGEIRVFFDGRDPEIRGEGLSLPRRERRILEYLVKNRGRRVTKTQIFNAIYGIFDEQVEENVVESHISKLRKKLRERLGYDLIESKRYLGYCLEERCGAPGLVPAEAALMARPLASAA